jgi:hypothetical protein
MQAMQNNGSNYLIGNASSNHLSQAKLSKVKSSKKQFAAQMNEYDEEDEDEEDEHTHTHTHSNSRDPRNPPPMRKPAEEMMKN